MSDFHNPPTQPVASKQHRCIYCFGPIPKGEQHHQQTGNYDGRWYRNRFHDECWEDLSDWGSGEFTPGSGDMPERIVEMMDRSEA